VSRSSSISSICLPAGIYPFHSAFDRLPFYPIPLLEIDASHLCTRGPFREPPSNIKSRFRVLNPIVGFPLFSHDGRFPVLVVYSPLQSMSPLCPLQPTGIQPFNCSSIALGPQLCILGILVVDSRSRYSVLRLDAPHLSQGAFREPPF